MTPAASAAFQFTRAERRVCGLAEQLLNALASRGYPTSLEPEVAALRQAVADHRAARAEFQKALTDAVEEVRE